MLLIVAKAPVPGLVKTRLAAGVGPRAAAELATASLLDTLAAAAGTGWPIVVALTGDLDRAPGAGELREALAGCTVIDQRGRDLGERLAAAHADAATAVASAASASVASAASAASASRWGPASPSVPRATVQIGMDTPQVESVDLVAAYHRLAGHDAVVGPAPDGGWWLLAARQPAVAACLAAVPMSRSDTGARTVWALGEAGWRVAATESMRDVDTAADADMVATSATRSRFAARWATVEPVPRRRVAHDRGALPVGGAGLRHSSEDLAAATR